MLIDTLIQYFLAPIITGVLIFIAQFFLLPKLEESKTMKRELWIEKKNTFIEALILLNKKYETLGWGKKEPSEFKELNEVNKIYGKLIILSKNSKIPESFWKFFDSKREKLTAKERGDFIVLLQKELGQKTNTKPDEMPIFINQENNPPK